jgi:proprotein convertase subtilisin/kexin type 5
LCTVCYSSCNVCTGVGIITDHKCSTCKANYYKQDSTNNCFLSTATVNGHYYNSDLQIFKACPVNCSQCTNASTCTACKSGFVLNASTNSCTECYDTCSTCTVKGDAIDHKCTNCKPNLYFKDLSFSCYPSTLKIDQHYFDITTNKFLKCVSGCAVCTSQSVCTQCQDGFTLKLDKTCLQNNLPLTPGCHPTCGTCDTLGDIKDNKCKTCRGGYYLLENSNNCYQENSYIQGYYLDLKLKLFTKCIAGCSFCNNNLSCESCFLTHQLDLNTKLCSRICYSSCRSCDELGNSEIHKCTSCKDGFYFQDKSSSCYSSDQNLYSYYFNKITKMFEKCPENCSSCKESSSGLTCSNCIEGHFYNDLSKKCEICYPSCKFCKGSGTSTDHQCVACKNTIYIQDGFNCYEPPRDFYYYNSLKKEYSQCESDCDGCEADIEKYCSKCKINNSVMYYSMCIPFCPSGFKADKFNRCKPCKYFSQLNFEGSCVDKCPEKYININGICQQNCPSGQYMLNSTCLDNCPENYIVDNKLFECLPPVNIEEKLDNIFSKELEKPLSDQKILQLSESITLSNITITDDLVDKLVTVFDTQTNLSITGVRGNAVNETINESFLGIINLGDMAIFLNARK